MNKRQKYIEILKLVADDYELHVSEILGKSQKEKVVRARHVAMFLAVTVLDISLAETGRLTGMKDHTTVMHAVEKIQGLLKENFAFKERTERLIATCKSLAITNNHELSCTISVEAMLSKAQHLINQVPLDELIDVLEKYLHDKSTVPLTVVSDSARKVRG